MSKKEGNEHMSKKALYAGSFDPLTNGHLDLIYRTANLCDQLVVGIIENPQKKPYFTINQRKYKVLPSGKPNHYHFRRI